MCEREREREREICVCISVSERVCVCVCVCAGGGGGDRDCFNFLDKCSVLINCNVVFTHLDQHCSTSQMERKNNNICFVLQATMLAVWKMWGRL